MKMKCADRCSIIRQEFSFPGGRCKNLSIPSQGPAMVFCTALPPKCCQLPKAPFTCNPCECPRPRACCKPPPPCNAPELQFGQMCGPSFTKNSGGNIPSYENDNGDPYCTQIPAAPTCPDVRLRRQPDCCPTCGTGTHCLILHANPKPTIQPIQIWGCSPHKYEFM